MIKIQEKCLADFVYTENSDTVYNPTRASNSINIKNIVIDPTSSMNFVAGNYISLKANTTIKTKTRWQCEAIYR
ncbi:MAG: hypothetical protein HC831_24165 [Chloroflexia bacterium]|nr:hypothetical protein [Chloroflexia bacterium]